VLSWGIGLFVDDEGGYTSVAVACALLLSVTLVMSAAMLSWVNSRSADIQNVADATALAGENSVAAYCTVAQVLDACVLTMGLVGISVYATGLVVAAIPAAQEFAAQITRFATDIMEARSKFAKSAVKGLERLEDALPYLIVTNSASVVGANAGDSNTGLVGCAIPFPEKSQTDFSAMSVEVPTSDLKEDSERLRDASRRRDEAKKRADAAREKGWRADCVSDPSCLQERASVLAGLSSVQNPIYESAELWNFGAPISRSRAYYAARIAQEAPQTDSIAEMTNSACRERFYSYALRQMWSASFRETPEGEVEMSLPELPKNSAEMRGTELYEEASWPCSLEPGGITLHSSLGCPGMKGAYVRNASVAELESGGVHECAVCRMGVGDLGSVAAISMRATNGYEYYWAIIVEAAKEYEGARNEQVAAEREMKEIGAEGSKAFQEALELLSTPRPKLCPAGAWGCVAVVYRTEGKVLPSELNSSLVSAQDLPAGAALSAACLAPEEDTDGANVLSSFFDGITHKGFVMADLAGNVMGLWGQLMVSYGSHYESASSSMSGFLDTIDGVFGGTLGAWMKGRLERVISILGLEPADMSLRKPVLVSSQSVFDQAGIDVTQKARDLVNSLPSAGTSRDVAAALGVWVTNDLKERLFDVAELYLPGTDTSIPLTIDLAGLGRNYEAFQ
jgi:hypothetical protein